MAKGTPKGDRTTVNEKKNNKDTKRGKQQGKDDGSDSSSIVSFDYISYDSDFDEKANFELLKNHFDKKILLLQTEFQGKVDALHQVIKNKDEVIGTLNKEVGELKKSCDYLSDETSLISSKVKLNELAIESTTKKHDDLFNKATDLEDRSRRNNLIFYNIAEEPQGSIERENCVAKIIHLLKEQGFFSDEYTLEIDRAHRLGRKKADIDSRPRPIIVRFCFFQDKESVLRKGRLFKGCNVTASEDFSKATLELHKQLRSHVKAAQETLNTTENQKNKIVRYKVTYRRVVVTYSANINNPSAPTFTKTFTLDFIQGNKKWFVPPTRDTYIQVFNRHHD